MFRLAVVATAPLTDLIRQPTAVLTLVWVAAILFVAEAALPTAGLAGALALLASIGAAAGANADHAPWWPLAGPIVAVTIWAALIASKRASVAGEGIALAAFAAGGIGYGVATGSVATVVESVVASVLMALCFPILRLRAATFAQRPPQVGVESLVGEHAIVTTWAGNRGTVRLRGSLWSASSSASLQSGQAVEVVDIDASTLDVRPITVSRSHG